METRSADFFWLLLHNNSWASRGTQIEMHQSVMLKTCLLFFQFAFEYIFRIHLDALACISSTKFESNFRNPLIGCQCFNFVHPKAPSAHPNWRTHSNSVRPESQSVRPGRNDVLWIQCWKLLSWKTRPRFFVILAIVELPIWLIFSLTWGGRFHDKLIHVTST